MLSPFADEHSLYRIIRAAQRAPSVYNTQPWSFWIIANDRVELRANMGAGRGGNPGRWLRITDPAARELVISCGAALFNLRMAIRVTGHDLAVWELPDPQDDPALLASVEIVTGRTLRPTAEEQELYDAIPRRHTYRWPFTGRRVPANVLTEMELTAAQERAYLRALYPFQAAAWLQAARQAEDEQTSSRLYVAELSRWTGESADGLGVPRETYGPHPLTRSAPVRDFGAASRDSRPYERFESHPQLMSLATDDDRPLDWLRAGQALQRALLLATRYGVAASFLTQSLELADRSRERRRWPSAWTFHETPQMLLRVGYPDRQVPVAPREEEPPVVDLRDHTVRYPLPPAHGDDGQQPTARWHLRGALPG